MTRGKCLASSLPEIEWRVKNGTFIRGQALDPPDLRQLTLLSTQRHLLLQHLLLRKCQPGGMPHLDLPHSGSLLTLPPIPGPFSIPSPHARSLLHSLKSQLSATCSGVPSFLSSNQDK